LLTRALPRSFQRRQLARHPIERNREPDHLRALYRDQGGTYRDARRHANAF
jgi:hypothetical protein